MQIVATIVPKEVRKERINSIVLLMGSEKLVQLIQLPATIWHILGGNLLVAVVFLTHPALTVSNCIQAGVFHYEVVSLLHVVVEVLLHTNNTDVSII